MPRRTIYIQNPSSGSHFRTIDGGGTSSPRPSKGRKPKTTSTPSNYNNAGNFAVGYAGNYTQGTPNWSNWYNNFPNVQGMPSLPEGLAPSGAFTIFNGLTPEQFYDLQWDAHSGIDFWIWSINLVLAEGIDPASGGIQAPLGTPGQLTLSSIIGGALTGHYGTYGGPDATIPTEYWGTAAEGNPAAAQNYAGIYASYLRATGRSTAFQNSYQRYLESIGQAP